MSAILLGTDFQKRVLVIDNDSQSNTIVSFGIEENQIEKSIWKGNTNDYKFYIDSFSRYATGVS